MDATAIVAATLATAGAALTALVTWLVARRQTSGRVATSDAEQLWQESQSMRADMRKEIVGLRSELEAARKETHDLRVELEASRKESRALRAELATLRRRMAESEGRIDHLEEDQEHGG